MVKILTCPIPGCGRELPAKFIDKSAFVNGREWQPIALAERREFEVVCPDHGEQPVIFEGHHADEDEIQFDGENDPLRAVAWAAMRRRK
jgi:hypothetical protein